MSRSVTIDGETYTLPTAGERNWAANLGALLLALIDAVNAKESEINALESAVDALQEDVGELQAAGSLGSIISFVANTVRSNTTDGFLWPWGENDTVAAGDQVMVVPVDGTLSKMQARLHLAVSDVNTTFTVRKNGVDTALTCTIAAAGQTGADSSNSVSVAAGDRISLKVVNSGSPANVFSGPRASLLFTPAAETP